MHDPVTPSDLRRAVGASHGLAPALADLLVGDTAADMSAHAERLAAVTVSPAAPPNPADGFDGGTPRELPRGPNTREAIADFARRDPRGFNAAADRGDIDLSKVR
ncbi:hypothetical protein FSW04_09910 [Baekduia soli]|uniref:Uncharacterized protein n=1 Tax=Baekduia soli TaxID=496014 RepID=A0A5B8U462_9ACTN|nr:hypothetical protein [Baekduia soli]QEC47854.1 hypothetical protein FSW04_09910 [Baekduia soli]